ncbi:dUTP diphosphatase [Patescibacteria group bacterium]|nr:dUTP diphosphatase [Patescibacteria group bacterium]
MKKKIEKKKVVKKTKKEETKFVLEVKKVSEGAFLPEYMFDTDVGLDLRAQETVSIHPLEQQTVKTGIAVKIPEGHVGLIRDRVGIVSKMGVHTAAGTFDSAYTGEVSVVLVNLGEGQIEIEKGMRIAQLVIIPVRRVSVKEVSNLSVTQRGEKSFGSTGFKERFEELNKLSKEIKSK